LAEKFSKKYANARLEGRREGTRLEKKKGEKKTTDKIQGGRNKFENENDVHQGDTSP